MAFKRESSKLNKTLQSSKSIRGVGADSGSGGEGDCDDRRKKSFVTKDVCLNEMYSPVYITEPMS